LLHSHLSHRSRPATKRTSPSRLCLAALGLVLAVAGCKEIRVRSDPALEALPASLESYAWLDTVLAAPTTPSDEFQLEVRAAIDRGLANAGYEHSAPGAPDFFVDFETDVVVEERAKDPYFAGVRSETYELGTLTIEWFDPKTLEPMWSGSGSSKLRSLATSGGTLSSADTPVPNEGDRDWQIEKKVAAILAKARPRE